MANIKNYIENIRSAIFGKEVRGSLADGLAAINKETENTTSRQRHLEDTFDQLIINEGNSNAEIVDARVGENGSSFEKLGDRIDNFDSQLATIASLVRFPRVVPEIDDTGRMQRALDTGKIVHITDGEYYVKEVKIKTNGQMIFGSKRAIINHDSHCFTIETNVKDVCFDGFTIRGSLKYSQLIAVDKANKNRLKFAENVFSIGDTISGSNMNSIGQMDTKRATITAFDGEYYTADLTQFGFDGNVDNKTRQYFPQNVGNFDWTTAIRGQNYNDGVTLKNMTIENERGYFAQFNNTSNITMTGCVFDTCGMDMFNFGLNTIDIENFTIKDNIFKNQVNFGKQGIYLSSKNNKVKNFVLEGNVIDKCTESFLSFFYSDCVFDGLTVKDNRFKDVDLYAVTGSGSNIWIKDNVFETVEFKTSDKTSMARTAIGLGEYLKDYTANIVTEYRNILIEGNTFKGRTAIDIGTINKNASARWVIVRNNDIDVYSGGINCGGIGITIDNNTIKSDTVADATYQWCGLFINGISDNIDIKDNKFYGETRIRFNQLVAKTLNAKVHDNEFEGNFCYIGGNVANLQNNNLVSLDCYKNKIKTENVYIDSSPLSTYHSNFYIANNVAYEIPYVRNLSNKRYMSTSTNLTESWRDTITSAWLGKYFKIGDKTYLVQTDKTNFYAFKNDVIYDGTTFKVVTSEGFLTA